MTRPSSPGNIVQTGRTLGRYRLESKLGEGGMGVVWEGTDTRLGRKVAIKLLHDSFLEDEDLMARFEREARVLASLNHPNIAAIHGLEEASGTRFLVLEYVPGDTLADRVAGGPISLTDALTFGRQIAEALEAAHERGIVHRDLKPANIKITPEGLVKVLDFGLAKTAVDSPPESFMTQAPTASPAMTRTGAILGTWPYMSPEQACGKPVDHRTDIWAFGCVLFEILARRRTFDGGSSAEVLVAVLERSPDWRALPAAVPGNVRSLLRRCLAKDRRVRLRDIGDARLELEETLSGEVGAAAATTVKRTRAVWPIVAAACLLGAAAVGTWGLLRVAEARAPEIVRFALPLPQGHRIVPGWNPSVIFSPDGRFLAFSYAVDGVPTTFRRSLAELAQEPLGGVRGLDTPVIAPDGRFAAMVDNMNLELKKIAVDGGAPVPLTGVDMFGRGDWGRDGFIYFTDRYPGAIVRVPESGGAHEPVTTLDPRQLEFTHRHAQLLPGGKAILFTVVSAGMASYDEARVELQVLATRERKVLVRGGFGARYCPSGHLVYGNGGNLYAVAFDPKSMETKGLPLKVVEGVQMSINTGAADFDISSTGTLAYLPGRAEGGARTLVWVDRLGRAETLPLKPASYLFPRVSPDGKALVVEIEGATHNLYTYDFARTVMTRLTNDGLSHAPVWAPDGKNIFFRSWKAGTMTMWEMPSDRSRPESRITNIGARQSAVSVSPDGRYLAFTQMGDTGGGAGKAITAPVSGADMAGSGEMGTGSDIWVLPLQGGDRTPQRFKGSSFDEASPKFSPDGKLVAYCSNETGRSEVYVEPWPGPGWKIQISSEGGTDPIWNRLGHEIFYRTGDKMMVVPVKTAGSFEPGMPRMLWEGHYSHGMSSSCGPPGVSSADYDVASDGQHFLMVRDNTEDVGSTSLVVVLNWAEELKRMTRALR